jgi:DNA polymerase-3 subunit alpha
MTFVHLHTHSHFSLLEAVPQISDLVDKAKSYGYTALALTDTNNLYAAIEFQKECQKAGIKNITGTELFVAEKSMHEEINTTTNRVFRMVFLCKNEIGYKNLVKLVSHAHILPTGKRVPCVDAEEIKKFKEGLICLSGLTESYLWEKLRTDDVDSATHHIQIFKEIFANDFYLELASIDTAEAKSVRAHTIQLSKDLQVELVATSNSHYLNLGDRPAQKVLMGISNEVDGKDRFKRIFMNGNFTFHSPQEIEKFYADIPEAIENTQKVADKCNLEIILGKWVFPKIEIPGGLSPDDYLKKLVYEGFKIRNYPENEVTLNRANYELDVIKMKGYAPYFLCVADMLRAAKEKNILTNIRGSVSGSLVTYLSGITNIDPIKFEIPFERFPKPRSPFRTRY